MEDQPSTSTALPSADTPAPPSLPIPMSRRSSSSDGGDYGGDLFPGDYDDDYDIPSVQPQSVGPPQDAFDEPEEEEEVSLMCKTLILSLLGISIQLMNWIL